MTPVFVDTNVFLYAAGGEHPLREASRAVLSMIGDGRLASVTSTEVVQEILYVLGRVGRRDDGIVLARRVIDLFPDMLPVTRSDMKAACLLAEQHPGLPPRDVIHAATMLERGLHRIVSTDRHFDAFDELQRLDPGSVSVTS